MNQAAEPIMQEVIISLTHHCNLHCAMCDIPLSSKPLMDTLRLRALLHELKAYNPQTVVLSGGEPFMRSDLIELLSCAHEQYLRTCITSNGTMITANNARALRGACVSVVNISLEGRQEIHDKIRGKGSYQAAKQALAYLADVGIEITIATVISKLNIDSLEEVVRTAHTYGATTIKFQLFNTLFLNDITKAQPFLFSSDDLPLLQKMIQRVAALCQQYGIATNPAGYFEALPYFACGQAVPFKRQGCQALWTSCPIDSDGTVYPCWVMTGQPIGSVCTQPFGTVWNSAEHRRIRSVITQQGCPGCFMSCYDKNYA